MTINRPKHAGSTHAASCLHSRASDNKQYNLVSV